MASDTLSIGLKTSQSAISTSAFSANQNVSDSREELESFGKKFHKKENKNTYLDISSSHFTSTYGAYQLFKFIGKLCAWPILFAKELTLSSKSITKISNVQRKFKIGEKFLLFPKMISDVKGLKDSYSEYSKAEDKTETRKRDKLVKKIVETVADCSFFLQLGEIIGIYALGIVIGPAAIFTGSLFLLFQHAFALKIEREDFVAHGELKEKEKTFIEGNKRLTTIFSENKNLHLLKITKTVISIALCVFMLTEFVFCMTVLSPTALLLLSTATTVLAIWTQFYQESMTYLHKRK
ncbi:MAG: hypothetical protein K1060chlam1_00869 [Candidatus Anoxychlamydiales bacterium]|nr:hypothetical protein [Candidatus Anoxychlamydiales bacterium]